MSEPWPELIAQTLARRPDAARKLVDQLYPVVQARVARVLWRTGRGSDGKRDVRQEVLDMTQDVFRELFDDHGKALRAWDPARGLSLPNFVGLLAERHAVSVLRSDRRNPWTEDPTLDSTFERHADTAQSPEPAVLSRDLLETLLDRLRVTLSPLGMDLFQRLFVDERPVEEVAATLKMSTEAIYAWRSRLRKLVTALAAELQGPPTGEMPRAVGEERARHE